MSKLLLGNAGIIAGSVAFVISVFTAVLPARAESEDPVALLKSMTDYVNGQKSISVVADADIEVVTYDLQKIQFTSSIDLLMSRPDKLRASRRGGYADVDLIFDGKSFTLLGKYRNVYAQVENEGTTDQLIDRLRQDYSIEAPGADLLLTSAYDELMRDVSDAKYIGHGVVGGVDCDHLAFRKNETDWQIWIERGSKPIPRKYVITSKGIAGAPQYTLVIRDWQTEKPIAAEAFAFVAPAGAKKMDVSELAELDEVPPGIVEGEKK
ncbi:MAG: DUF2092 domain-containing protein [Alphaproteobacteria bacterium]|nr:DUF2092 domain-containing protein [Alphaproteobacteria bacterium]